jgi:hypothetical protein
VLSHQSAQPLAEGEIAAVFEGVDGIEKDRLVNTKRASGADVPLLQEAIAADVIGAIFDRVRDSAYRAKGCGDETDPGMAVGAEGMFPALRQDPAARKAQCREEQFREGREHCRHITSPCGAI